MVTQGAATIIHEVSGLSFFLTLPIAWAGYTLFTLYSGSRGVVLTDTLMFLLFASVAFLGLAFIVDQGGGWFAAVRDLAVLDSRPDILSWHGTVGEETPWATPVEALVWSMILGIAWGIVVAVSPWQASRYLMARNEHVVIRSATITAGMVMVLYAVLMFSGAAVNLLNPAIEPAQENMIWAAMNAMPPLLGVLIMSGILAAALSSASTFLSLSGFSISNDIRMPPDPEDPRSLGQSRWAMFGVSLAALLIAYLLPEGRLFWITYFAGTLFASSWGPVAFMSVWSGRVTEAGAFWGIIAGLTGNLLFNAISVLGLAELPVYLNPILVGVVLSWITIEAVSARGRVSAKEHAFRAELHITPESEFQGARVHRTVLWSWALIAAGVLTAGLMTFFYALPYREAAGVDGTGEIAMSLGVGLSMIVAGALARWGTLRSYGDRASDK
jgi:sodium/pantothenate symporter